MPGVGQQFLPKPQFSSANPYWRNPADDWPFLLPDYRPKLSAQDFMFATTWEIWRPDWHMANLVRIATQRTVRINFLVLCRAQVKYICINQKEKQREKTAS
jgi:hypothetical protein